MDGYGRIDREKAVYYLKVAFNDDLRASYCLDPIYLYEGNYLDYQMARTLLEEGNVGVIEDTIRYKDLYTI